MWNNPRMYNFNLFFGNVLGMEFLKFPAPPTIFRSILFSFFKSKPSLNGQNEGGGGLLGIRICSL